MKMAGIGTRSILKMGNKRTIDTDFTFVPSSIHSTMNNDNNKWFQIVRTWCSHEKKNIHPMPNYCLFILSADDKIALVPITYPFQSIRHNFRCLHKRRTLFHEMKFNFRTKTIIESSKCDNFTISINEQHEYAFRIQSVIGNEQIGHYQTVLKNTTRKTGLSNLRKVRNIVICLNLYIFFMELWKNTSCMDDCYDWIDCIIRW